MDEHDSGKPEHAEQCEGEQDDDDGQCEEDVAGHDAAASSGVRDRRRNLTKVVSGEGDVGRLDGSGRTGRAHGDADGRGREGRRIVDAVAHHGGRCLTAHRLDDIGLVLGELLGVNGLDASLASDRPRGAGVVAGDHHRGDARGREVGDGFGGFGLQLVTHPDHSEHLPVTVDDDDAPAVIGQCIGGGRECAGGEPAVVADGVGNAVDGPGDAVSRELLDVGGGEGAPARVDDRTGERVRTGPLQGRRDPENLGIGGVGGGQYGHDLRLVARQGPGLVEGDLSDRAELLEGFARLDDHAQLARRADRGDHRDGHRDGHRARRRRHKDDEGALDPHRGLSEPGADHRDECGGDEHDRDQGAGDAVGKAGAVALALVGLLHEPDDRRQRVVGAGRRGPQGQAAASVDAPGQHLGAGADLQGDRLSGDGRGVDHRAALRDHAVGCDPLTGSDDQDVADLHVGGFDRDVLPVAHDAGRARDQ